MITAWIDKGRLLIKQLKMQFSLWMLLPMYAFASLGAGVYISSVDYSISAFVDRIIGAAIASAYNPAARKTTFFLALLIWLVLALLTVFVLTLAKKKFKSLSLDFSTERDVFITFSLILIYCVITWFSSLFSFHGDMTLWQHNDTKWIAVLMLALVFHCGMRLLSLSKHVKIGASMDDNPSVKLALAFILPIPFAFVYQCLVSPADFIVFGSIKSYLRYLLLFGAFRLILPKMDARRVIISSVPLLLIPLSACVAEEIQYSLRYVCAITTEKVGSIIFALLFMVSGVCFFLSSRSSEKKKRFSCDQLLIYLLFPLLLISLTSIMAHTSILSASYDLLHSGNAITPVQQLVQYGQVPFLDYWGAQHFQFGALFYSLINGSNILEPMIWNNWFNCIAFTLILYFFIGELYNHRWALLLIIFLPMLNLIDYYYLGALLPLLTLPKLLTERKTKYYICFLGLGLVAFACMPSQGMAAIVASYLVLLSLGFNKKNFTSILTATVVVFVVPACIYFALNALKGHSVGGQIALIKSFVNTDNYEGPYSDLFGDPPEFLIILQYAILPLINAVICAQGLVQKQKSLKDYIRLFTTIASLTISTRVLGRHCLLEGFQVMLYVPMLLTIPTLLKKRGPYFKQSVSFIILVIYAFSSAATVNKDTIACISKYSYRSFSQEDQRYIPDESQIPTLFVKLIDNALDEDQTFFDMTSSHMLYTLTNRKAPLLHHSIACSQSQDAQIEYVKRMSTLYDSNQMPLVLWGGGYEYMDRIPMAITCFYITEYIYQHYHPWISVDSRLVWVANNSDLPATFDYDCLSAGNDYLHTNSESSRNYVVYDDGSDNRIAYAQHYNYWKIPYVWGTYDENINIIKSNVQARFNSRALPADVPYPIPIPAAIDKTTGNYLYLQITFDGYQEEDVALYYGLDHTSSIEFTILPGTNDYLIRISSINDWKSDKTEQMSLITSCDVQLDSIAILKGDPYTTINER